MADTPSALLPTNEQEQASGPVIQQTQPQPSSGYQIPLLQNDTDTLIPVAQDDADVAIRSGLYSPKSDQKFLVQDQYGNLNEVQGAHLREAMDAGYRLESSEQRHSRELQENYGGASGVAQAFAAGIPRGGTLGLSDVAASTSEDATHHLANLEEANPVASTLGEVTGFVLGSMLGSTEESLAARTVGGVAKGVETIGAKTAAAVEKALIKDAAKAGVSKRIAASLAAKSAGGAVEGAFFGAGQLLSEDALGKADFNAENLIGAIGMGALLGGTISGGMEAITQTAKSVAPILRSAASPLARKISDSLDEKVASGRLFGLTPNQLGKLEKRSPKVVADMQTYLKEDLQLGIADSAEDLAAKNKLVKQQSGDEISSVLAEIDNTLKAAPELKPTSAEVWGNVWDKAYSKFQDFLSTAAPSTATEKRQISKFLNEVDALRKTEGEFGAKDLQKIKRIQDELMSYNKEPGKWTLKEDLVYLTRTAMRDEIDSLAQKLEKNGLSGDLAGQLKAANRRYSSSATFGDFLDSRAAKAADRDFSLMNSVRDVGLDISRKLVVLGKLEKANQSISSLAKKSISGFINPVISTVKKSAVPFSIMNSEFTKKFEDGKYKKPKSESDAYANLQENIERYALDPEAFIKRVNRGTSAIYSTAPNTASALDATAVRAAIFIGSKLPKKTASQGAAQMLKRPRPPSKFDLAKVERYLDAVENPKSVFESLENGRLSTEGAETLKNVYPNLYTQLQDKALQLMGSQTVPYNKRLQLGLLLDVPTDESLIPENILGLQANFSQQNQTGQGAVNSTVSGMNNIDKSGRLETDTQDSEVG